MTIKTLSLIFDIPLLPHQLPMWRGAIAEHAGWEVEAFHNHAGAKERVHYRYPSVQYRSVGGQAAVFAVGEGVEAVQEMLLRSDGHLRMGGDVYRLRIDKFQHEDHLLSMGNPTDSISPEMEPYFLKNWIALNADNFKEWNNLPSLTARTQKLEQILASNIIAFAKGIHWQLPERLEVSLLQLRSTHTIKHKGIPMMAFDVSFAANIALPDGLGLGKACSHGFGVVMPFVEKVKEITKEKRPRKKVLAKEVA